MKYLKISLKDAHKETTFNLLAPVWIAFGIVLAWTGVISWWLFALIVTTQLRVDVTFGGAPKTLGDWLKPQDLRKDAP